MIQNPIVTEDGGNPVLQTKSVSPSESSQNVTPDAGYDGLSKVTVGAIQTESKTVTSNGTVTPSSGKYLKQVTVNVPSSGIDTSDATATAEKILKGATAYVKGKKVTGTIAYFPKGSTISHSYMTSGAENVSVATIQSKKYLDIESPTIVNPVAFLENSTVSCGTLLSNLGDATAADVAQGKTFTSASGLKVTGTHICSGGIDTSDATATPDDMREGTTAYVNGEKVTGTIPLWNGINWDTPTVIWDSENKKLTLRGSLNARRMIKKDSISTMHCSGEKLGDATTADVAKGKTFTSASGLKVTGTHICSGGIDTSDATATASDILSGKTAYVNGSKVTGSISSKAAATYTPGTEDQTIVSGQYLSGVQTIKGDANLVAGNIKSGVSIFGVAGSFEGSGGGGGSGDNNCEAYHITSESAKLNFKTTGTVKVWGYGYKSSGYTGTHYSFVGDGYYSGSYGTPSKTMASFSINADGTLNGLPSDLQAVDLLVTIGV